MAKTNKLHGRFRSTVLDALLKLKKKERKECPIVGRSTFREPPIR
jgi:hypothetical protein